MVPKLRIKRAKPILNDSDVRMVDINNLDARKTRKLKTWLIKLFAAFSVAALLLLIIGAFYGFINGTAEEKKVFTDMLKYILDIIKIAISYTIGK